MNLLVAIAAWSLLAFGLLLFLLQLGAHEIGYRFGRLRGARLEAPAESVGAVVGGMLGLLAFVLALTLSFASNSFSERRAGTLAEANAIGTAWLRAQAIGGPRGSEIARLLEQYTHLRIDFIQAENDPAAIDDLNRRTNALQTENSSGWRASRDASHCCLHTGDCCRGMAEQWELCEARVSRTVLRAPGGETPPGDSPQHLCSQSSCRRAGHGLGEPVPDHEAAAEGQRGEERGGASGGA
jgi:hypothetical protein